MIINYDYQCGNNNYPNQCDIATIKIHSCNTNSYSALILITNKCFNVQNNSFLAECNNNNDGNIFEYNSLDCEGISIKDDFFYLNDANYSTTYSPNCNRVTSQCHLDLIMMMIYIKTPLKRSLN